MTDSTIPILEEPTITDEMALAFHRALTDGAIGQEDLNEIKVGLRAALSRGADERAEEDAAVIDKLANLLAGVAVALKGDELPLHRHSYHDLPELAGVLKLELDLYRSQAPQSAAPAPAPAGDASMLDAIREALSSYRSVEHVESDGDCGLPLSDLLTHGNDIGPGLRELESLAGHIYDNLPDATDFAIGPAGGDMEKRWEPAPSSAAQPVEAMVEILRKHVKDYPGWEAHAVRDMLATPPVDAPAGAKPEAQAVQIDRNGREVKNRAKASEGKMFKTDVLGVGPFCVEFPDGEIIHTRSEERQRAIASIASPSASQSAEARRLVEAGWRAAMDVHSRHGMAGWSSHREQAIDSALSWDAWSHNDKAPSAEAPAGADAARPFGYFMRDERSGYWREVQGHMSDYPGVVPLFAALQATPADGGMNG